MTDLPKVAIYCRLSEEDRYKSNETDDSESIKNQKAMLMQYSIDHDWLIYDIYSDDDFTGSDRNRPAFNKLLKDAEAGKFNIVLCKTQSRFTRELEMVEKYIHYYFPLWGVRFVSIVDNADTDVKGNKKSRQINGLINEWYLEDMSENIKAVLTNRRKNGFFIGAFAPFGYMKDPAIKGHLLVDEPAAEVVRRIYDLYLSGIGCTSIARILNADGILSPAEYKTQNGFDYKSNHYPKSKPLWRYFMVNSILSNEVYIGNLVQNKAHSISYKTKIIKPTGKSQWIRVENTHEPIIDKEVWLKVQSIKSDRAIVCHTDNSKKVNIFSKKLFCCHCGGTLILTKTKTSVGLICGVHDYDKARCPEGVRVTYKRLYDVVLQELKAQIVQHADADYVSGEIQINNSTQSKIIVAQEGLEKSKRKLQELLNANKTLYLDKLKGIIAEEMFIELSAGFTADIEQVRSVITKTERRIEELREIVKSNQTKMQIAKEYLDMTDLNFEIVHTFIDKIIVHPTPKYSREVNIEIFWNF